MQRVQTIDGIRGYFLVFMLVNHLVFTGDYWLVHTNLRELAFVEDAQGFVFLSGLLVGVTCGRRMLQRGFASGARAARRRAGEIYLHAMAVILLALAAAALFPAGRQAWGDWLGGLDLKHPTYLAPVAAMIFQPTFMDILPQYVVYMLVAPPVVWACVQGRCAQILVGSFVVWLAAQFGVHSPFISALNGWLTQHGELGVRANFNLLGWQVVFFTGAVLGVLTVSGRVRWDQVFTVKRSWVAKAALAVCLFFLPLRLATSYNLAPRALLAPINLFADRSDFGLVYLANFAAAAIGFAWLMIAGPKSPRAWIRRLSGMLHALFQTPFLRLLGRHSLEVYCWHLLLVYLVRYWDLQAGPFPEFGRVLIGLAGVALLAIPCLWLERTHFIRDRAAPSPGAALQPVSIADPGA